MLRLLKTEWGTVAGIIVLTVLVYAEGITLNDWVNWDDRGLIIENSILLSFNWQTLWAMWSSYDPELYIPLTFMSYQFDRLLAGGTFNPHLTHLVNVLLHAGNAVLVGAVLGRLTTRRSLGVIAGILFAVHPLHTEAAMWASARKDVLATFFFLLSWLWYLRWRDGDVRNLRVSLVFFLAALLSKVIVITLPAVLLLQDWWQRRPLQWRLLREKWGYFALALVFGAVALLGKPGSDTLYFEKVLIGARAVWLYWQHLVVPHGLAVFYPFTEAITLRNPELLWSFLDVLGVTMAVIIAAWRGWRTPAFLWFLFGGTVLPTFANFTKGDNYLLDVYIGSDRYAYIPSIAFFLLIAYLLSKLWAARQRLALLLIIVVTTIYGYLAYYQAKSWRETAYLFLNVIAYYDNAHLAHNNLGTELNLRGLPEQALQQFHRSLAIRPNEKAYFNIGQYYMKKEQFDQARHYFLEALRQNQYHVETNAELGALFLILGKPEEAIKLVEVAALIEPEHFEATYNTGVAYERLGDRDQAVEWYKKALELRPEDEETLQKLQDLRL